MPNYPDPLTARLRYRMPAQFTTSEFKEEALKEDIGSEAAQEMLSYMIKRGFIRRVKRGYYQKCERYAGEQ